MARRFYDLPPLTMLNTFEAAARTKSFKEAAVELNVTPGAISHQVKALEQDLGVKLFKRSHRLVELTVEGGILFDALEHSFSSLSRSVQRVRRMTEEPSVSIGVTSAFSSLWLTPRITRFWKEFPDITVNQQVSDIRFGRPIMVDMIIEYGLHSQDERTTLLFEDELIPLCSPEFARQLGGVDLAGLAACPLIHMDVRNHDWTTWAKWFEALGYYNRIRSGPTVNNYSIALQMAQDGVGVVLGWKRQVRPLLERGVLVPISGFSIPAPGAFYLIAAVSDMSLEAEQFRQWLLEETSSEINSSVGEK